MAKRKVEVRAKMGFRNEDGTVRMVDIKTGAETIVHESELKHLTEIELSKMTS